MLKTILKSVREYKKAAFLAPIFVALEVILEVIIPTLMASLIDKGIEAGNMEYTIQTGIILVVLCVFSLLSGMMSGKYAADASAGFAKNLRKDMYYNVQQFAFSNIDKFSSASIVTRLTTDVTNVQQAFMMVIRVAVRNPMMIIFSFVMVLRINPMIALVFLAVIPIMAIALLILMKKTHPVFEKLFSTYDSMNNVVQENLRGIRVVKSYVREEHEIEKFRKMNEKMYELGTRAEKNLAMAMPVMQFCVYGSILFCSWFGANFIVAGDMTTGQLTSIFAYAMQILISLMLLSVVFVMITMSQASAQRIAELLKEESSLTNGENPIYEVPNGDILFENVSFGYSEGQDKYVLKNINLHIKPGQTVGIIGGTGSSKSSLVQMIPRLYDVNEGSVKVGGIDVRDYDIESLRNEVAMVLQKNVLFSGTIKDNLRWGNAEASDEELERVCKLAQADSFIQSFPDKYDTYIEQGGSNVSGGQKQRLCIARALLKKPKILILDDSTSAVDTHTDAMIRKAFLREIPDTTKLIIAQRISSVEEADLIIVLDNGEIVGMGTHKELLVTNSIYKEVFDSQVKGGEGNG
ncbi:MAG: ABC transporter ATP-binding protein [Lachnospiraceae bacterium]|nr:ABC transporter ATP-binding protein [Lachnospiraceae bacterium]